MATKGSQNNTTVKTQKEKIQRYTNLNNSKEIQKEFPVTGKYITKDTPTKELFGYMKVEKELLKEKKRVKEKFRNTFQSIKKDLEIKPKKIDRYKKSLLKDYKERLKELETKKSKKAKALNRHFEKNNLGQKSKEYKHKKKSKDKSEYSQKKIKICVREEK